MRGYTCRQGERKLKPNDNANNALRLLGMLAAGALRMSTLNAYVTAQFICLAPVVLTPSWC